MLQTIVLGQIIMPQSLNGFDGTGVTGISGSRIEDVMPVLSSAPALAVSAAVDSGSVEAVQTLRYDDLARQNGPQHA